MEVSLVSNKLRLLNFYLEYFHQDLVEYYAYSNYQFNEKSYRSHRCPAGNGKGA